MRVKSLLLIVVLNVFLTLLVSVMFEYNNLQERITSMEDTISECLLMAVDSATGSEEVFSDNYQNKIGKSIYSLAETSNKSTGNDTTSSTMLVYDKSKGKCYYANIYILAMCYTEGGKLPTESEYNNYANDRRYNTTAGVYRYLFGETGSDYTNSNLTWANKNASTRNSYKKFNEGVVYDFDKIGTDRDANTSSRNASGLSSDKTRELNDFQGFYDAIGKDIVTVGVMKEKSGDYYNVANYEYPVLAQMGLMLNKYNRTDSSVTNDNFTSVTHLGKRRLNHGAVQNSVYYLTPYSLGVTYIPQSVLESTFVANLDTLVRLQRVASGYTNGGDDSVIDAMQGSTGCVPTSVFAVGSDKSLSAELSTDADESSSRQMKTHDSAVSQDAIVNDGMIEYDLSSVQTKIDYKVVNFYDIHDALSVEIVNRVLGGVSNYTSDGFFKDRSANQLNLDTIKKLEESDTKKSYNRDTSDNIWDGSRDGDRIVARVTVRMKCHILYQSPILQWVSYATRDTYNENHFDIKLFTGKNGGEIVEDSDGVWYQYTTYKVVSR